MVLAKRRLMRTIVVKGSRSGGRLSNSACTIGMRLSAKPAAKVVILR